MESFRLETSQLPSRFYRVNYPESTPFSETMGFQAWDQSSTGLTSFDDLRSAVKSAFSWGSRNPSPFVAVFSDRDHAILWARSYEQRERVETNVVEIDTSKLRDIIVLKLSELVRRLDIVLPNGASQHEHGAYLCFKRIPYETILSKSRPFQLQTRVEMARDSLYVPLPSFDEFTHMEREAIEEEFKMYMGKDSNSYW